MIKSVSIVSRRSVKLGDEFYVFETDYTASVEELADKKIDDYVKSLYERANALVDGQVQDAVDALNSCRNEE